MNQAPENHMHFVCDNVTMGEVKVLHVPTTLQFADVFTKELPTSVLTVLIDSLHNLPHGVQIVAGC
jgi:hypothetical protein